MGPLDLDDGLGSFRFGAASAATQIEDQNPNVDWYVWTAPEPDGLGNGEFVGDAARGYSMALEDIELIAALGLDSYRFSIEWARIEPARDQIDEEALAHYDAFIDALLARGIQPLVTVHHFSNPIWVDDPRDMDCVDGPSDENLCGWNHPEGAPMILEELEEHTALLAERYGDRVDEWASVNEPINYTLAGYGLGVFPPGKNGLLTDFDNTFVAAVRNYVRAHVTIYDALKANDTTDADGDGQAASVGFTKGAIQWVAASGNEISEAPGDVEARDRVDYLYHHLFVRSVLEGAFDPDLDGTLDESHPEWEGKLDWLGLQYYFRAGVTSSPGLLPVVQATPCYGGFDLGSCIPPLDETFYVPAMHYEFNPTGLYERLVDFGERYPGLPLCVTEGGIATEVGARRSENIVRSLEGIARARDEGVDVRGYYHWSLTDNFEWAEGYEPRFGLYGVDYETYARTPSAAVDVFTEIIAERDLPAALVDSYGGDGPMTPEIR
jgi:beta-glucosidase